MSTKGMSVTASRMLLDRLAPQLEKVFVLHDFDVAGFSIFGTLANDGRRYNYNNKVPLFDIGLRLRDVVAMGASIRAGNDY
jgi:DNA topoisomerase VI subunit A